jgi:hypothetical protein
VVSSQAVYVLQCGAFVLQELITELIKANLNNQPTADCHVHGMR